jgi:osmotically inducible protein OsmC
MALSGDLSKAGFTPESVETNANVTLEMVDGAPTISKIKLTVKANIPDIDDDKFQEIANGAKKNCPVSRVLAGADISLDATLS